VSSSAASSSSGSSSSGSSHYREYRLTRTKIIATVGPACAEPEMLRSLVLSGVDIFRLNFAHGSHEWLEGIVRTIWEISLELGRPIGILGDLSGPKIRLGVLPGDKIVCNEGAEFVFIRGREPAAENELTCTYQAMIDDVKEGDRILLADGTVRMRVVETTADSVRCVVEGAGVIGSRQGVNLPGVALSTPCITEKDEADLAWAIKNELDFVGLSFVRSAEDIRKLRAMIEASDSERKLRIIAKIEKPEAVDDLSAIIDEADAVMVARGDLGVEVDVFRVPKIQKDIIQQCNEKRVPVITATQMLDSMQRSELPTRAEASDVANAVLDGTDAVMLSGETAAGDFPRQAVAMMSRIVQEAERILPERHGLSDVASAASLAHQVTEAVAVGAVVVAEQLDASLIAVATVSGRSALAISKERRGVPVLAICDCPGTAGWMTILWGVTPILASSSDLSAEQLVRIAVDWGHQEEVLERGSRLVVIASSRWATEGHNSLRVHIAE
jgi:pyruvate kinase